LIFLILEYSATAFECLYPIHFSDECRDFTGSAFQDDQVRFTARFQNFADLFCAVGFVVITWIPVLAIVSPFYIYGLSDVERLVVARVNEEVDCVESLFHTRSVQRVR